MSSYILSVIVAAFNSIIPIMWTPAYMIPQAAGYEVNKGDRRFTIVFVTLTGIGVFSPVLSHLLDLSVVDMAILFPTVNGIFGLPLAATLLFWAVNDRETMGEYRNSWWLNVVNASLVVLAITLGALAMQGFLELFTGGGF